MLDKVLKVNLKLYSSLLLIFDKYILIVEKSGVWIKKKKSLNFIKDVINSTQYSREYSL